MPALTFRFKLLAAMMFVVAGVTTATIFITQRRVEATYLRFFDQQSHSLNALNNVLQQTRLESSKQQCLTFAKLVRLRAILRRVNAAVESKDAEELATASEILHQTARNDLREILDTGERRAAFFRFLDASGRPIPPPATVAVGYTNEAAARLLEKQLASVGRSITGSVQQIVGILPVPVVTNSPSAGLLEVIVTKAVNPNSGETEGVLIIGFQMPLSSGQSETVRTGFFVEDRLYSETIPAVFGQRIAQLIPQVGTSRSAGGDFTLDQDGVPFRIFFQPFSPGSGFPAASSISVFVYSMGEAVREQREMRAAILQFAVLVFLVSLAIMLFLASSLSGPINELEAGAHRVQQGDFTVQVPVRSRDEVGRLASSFNEMTRGLAEREKFRNVLNMVADKSVAEEMMRGNIALGGEAREISVLFCDIRGFTALTQNMDPQEVIQMLNEHFTPLTEVVYKHHGVVDKFVGDLIMAVFGAPKSYGNDGANAASCAWDMIERRRKLNTTSRYQIEVGIGVATGNAVAGCMGSSDRLNYTVLGERVNLASRLCSKAGRMDVVIDQTTRERLGESARVEAMEPLQLKGFSDPVPAFRLLGIHNATSAAT